ncbi:F5/8 type C domain protein [Marssonina coronariae]|uniref:F5/8 type C domain protein n=1 Tax=Diplocarpon coronariae TaxID=2795749 RepID=A0A218Z1I0_9HELO|nr:F5/8 type C domain protein [Marssonina coronariae]
MAPFIHYAPKQSVSHQTHEVQAQREQILALVSVGVVAFSIIVTLGYSFYGQYQRINSKRQFDIEEGLIEVNEARAFRPSDSSLKDGSYTIGTEDAVSPLVRNPFLQSPPATLQVPMTPMASNAPMTPSVTAFVETHALFNPNMKRSRTLPRQKGPGISSSRARHGSISYPNIYEDEERHPLASHPSSSSLRSFYRGGLVPMAPSTTMQTRRPSSPPMILIPRTPGSPRLSADRRRVRSFWSLSEESIGHHSPSYESTTSEYPSNGLTALRAPSTFGFGRMSYPDSSAALSTTAGRIETPRRTIFPIDMKGNPPTLSYPLALLRRSSGTYDASELGLPQSPQSPRHEDDFTSPRIKDHSFLSQATFRDFQELSGGNIERWLSGSAGTASAFGSVPGSGRASSRRASSDLKMYMRRHCRISSITSMSSRRASGEEIFIGAAF